MNPLTQISNIKAIMQKHNFTFSKALGQNFLINSAVPAHIAEVAGVDENTNVIEIGPGFGTLTYELCKAAKKVVAIEIDKRLIPVLQDTMAEFDNLKIVNEDVLKLDLHKLIEEEFDGSRVIVCANLPYYITSPIIMSLLEKRLPVESITVMIQKEVAKRFDSKAGSSDYGAVTLSAQYYSETKLHFDVSPGSFMPAPKVTSSVISFYVRDEAPVKPQNEVFMFQIIKAAFNQRRKTLSNALANILTPKVEKVAILQALRDLGLNENIRGEALSLEDFARLSDLLLIKK